MKMSYRDVVACPECLSWDLEFNHDTITCINCVRQYAIKDDIPYFSKVNDDFAPKKKSDTRNPKNWTPWRKENFRFFENQLRNLDSSSHILDLGAGQGHFSSLFEQARFISIDFYPFATIDIVSDFTKRLPIKPSLFDYVILSNVLEHLREPAFLLKECHRVIKSGGKLLITVPFLLRMHQEPYDYNRYTHFMLEYLLREADFKVAEINKIHSIVDLYRSMRSEFYKSSVKPRVIWKLFRGYWWIIDRFYDNMLVDEAIKTDPNRAYFVGYSCSAIKK
jgi:SAM-dependent methyltransferase